MLHPALVSVVKIGTGPEPVLLVLDVLADHRDGRPGSAAKKAEALFKIALARVSSRTSFSRSRIRAASSVVVPGRSRAFTWARRTQPRRRSA